MSRAGIPPGVRKHVRWIESEDGLETEVLVMKESPNGDIYYIRVSDLDEIDKYRIYGILSKPDADKRELWDVLSMSTLSNGMNALTFFDQLVRAQTKTGKQFPPKRAVRGGVGNKTSFTERPAVKAPAAKTPAKASAAKPKASK